MKVVKMKYSEIFNSDFIEKLNEIKTPESAGIDANKNLEHEYVDVENIVQSLGFKVERIESLGASGQLDDKLIKLNKDDVSYRQRFSIAHELGHAMQGQSKANRLGGKPSDYSIDEQKDEVFANKFAARLLMPLKLVSDNISSIISLSEMNPSKLSHENVDFIMSELSSKLQVSLQSVEFRVRNLNIFIESEEE